jgi:hypothetical protein
VGDVFFFRHISRFSVSSIVTDNEFSIHFQKILNQQPSVECVQLEYQFSALVLPNPMMAKNMGVTTTTKKQKHSKVSKQERKGNKINRTSHVTLFF